MENDFRASNMDEDDEDFFEDFQSININHIDSNNPDSGINDPATNAALDTISLPSHSSDVNTHIDYEAILKKSFPLSKTLDDPNLECFINNIPSLEELCQFGDNMPAILNDIQRNIYDKDSFKKKYKKLNPIDEEYDFTRPWSKWATFEYLLSALDLKSGQLNNDVTGILQPTKISEKVSLAPFHVSLDSTQDTISMIDDNLVLDQTSTRLNGGHHVIPLASSIVKGASINIPTNHSMPNKALDERQPGTTKVLKGEMDIVQKFLKDLPNLSFMRSHVVVDKKS